MIGQSHSGKTKANVFRFKSGLDDPELLFWRPLCIDKGEWPFIFVLKLNAGSLEASD